jgi:hypothetical protein
MGPWSLLTWKAFCSVVLPHPLIFPQDWLKNSHKIVFPSSVLPENEPDTSLSLFSCSSTLNETHVAMPYFLLIFLTPLVCLPSINPINIRNSIIIDKYFSLNFENILNNDRLQGRGGEGRSCKFEKLGINLICTKPSIA